MLSEDFSLITQYAECPGRVDSGHLMQVTVRNEPSVLEIPRPASKEKVLVGQSRQKALPRKRGANGKSDVRTFPLPLAAWVPVNNGERLKKVH